MYFRQPAVAGAFYPAEAKSLKAMIKKFLEQASVVISLNKPPKAIIVPHAGYIYSGSIAAYGFKLLKNFSFKTIILLGASHHFSFQGIVAAPTGIWETPLGQVKTLSKDDFHQLKDCSEIIISEEIHQPEHSLEVELPFLQFVLQNFKILPLLTSETDTKKIINLLQSILDNDTLLVVSSDFSHYLSSKEAKMIDKVTIDAILANDSQRFNNYGEACGKIPIAILLGLAKQNNWQPKLLMAANSGETCGDRSQVVGYAAIAFL